MTRNAIDMSSYIKTALQAGTDTKDGITTTFEDKVVTVNSAEYGYENFTNMMIKTMRETNTKPKDLILVFEGKSSKAKRLMIDVGYKAKRDKKPPEFYEQFQRLREFIESQWLGLGAISMCQDYAEGDDTLAWLARETEEDLIISSRDGDLGVLNTPDGETNAYGAKVLTYNDGLLGIPKVDSEVFVHPPKYITLYKALVGDSSDSVSGVKGFGPAKFQTMAETYGYDGLDELVGMLEQGDLGPIHGLAEEMKGKKPAHPILKMIVEHEADAIRCWKLVKMYPEWVNTMKTPLRIQGGKLSSVPADVDERLKDFYSQEWLVTADNYEDSLAFFKQWSVGPEVAFDIESSTPDESDEWLKNIPKGKGQDEKVDQLGQVLTGFSFTFGANNEFTFYVSVDHHATNNVPMSKARQLIETVIDASKQIVIHNNFFELTVLGQAEDEDGTKWMDIWAAKYPQWHGFLPRSLDTKMESSYFDENFSNGLKFRSKHHLGYEQTSYKETTTLSGWADELPPGGRGISIEYPEAQTIDQPDGTRTVDEGRRWETRQYKMRELPADHVTAYGCDDTINTAALHNLYKLVMQLEHTWKVYLDVEIDASYQHAKNFLDGIPFSLEKHRELEMHDDKTWDASWAVLREFLMKNGWDGTVPPTYGPDIDCKAIKQAYRIAVVGGDKGGVEVEEGFGEESEDDDEQEDETVEDISSEEGEEPGKDPVLASKIRTPSKLIALIRAEGHEVFASMVERCIDGEHELFTSWVRESFTGEPLFKIGNHQMCKLLYTVMGLPVRVRSKPTKIMRAKKIFEGNPKADVLALEYALRDGTDEQKAVIEAIKKMSMVKTRRSLYYTKYPYFVHWKTGRIHPSHNQCQTNTRRASESSPNKTQLPKDTKITGEPARYREVIVPHHEDAVVVSLDFDSQELRVIGDYSQDENMVACFVGDNKKSMHSLTGQAILEKRNKLPYAEFDYTAFNKAAKTEDDPYHKLAAEYRKLGKKVNFTTEFGAMAPKLAMTMLCSEAEAQVFINAKEAMFPGVRIWKDAVIAEAKRTGLSYTKLGARRHLREALTGDDHWIRSKAERQAVNFRVQSSSAEMTKKAEARMWQMGLVYKYDCICFGPIHDEVVFSVAKKDLAAFLKDAHWCMTQPYADMTIPIESSISFGPSFGEQVEIGTSPTEKAVAEGWRQVEKLLAKAKQTPVTA